MFTKNWYALKAKGFVAAPNSVTFPHLVNTNGVVVGYPTLTTSTTYEPYSSVGYIGPEYSTNLVKIDKSEWPASTGESDYVASAPSTYFGVVFGNGTDPEGLDNYTMSGDIFTTFNTSSDVDITMDSSGATYSRTYTITNTGEAAFTISEIGMISYTYHCHQRSSTYTNYRSNTILIERTLLDVPITIEAGGVGQVTYTLRYEWPTT